MKKICLTLGLLTGFFVAATAQKDKQNVNKYLDYNYEKKDVKERKVVPYPALREADVIYAKRVERVIDTREKKNQVMVWPKSPLNRIIYNAVISGEEKSSGKLKAYSNDSMDKALTIADIKKIGGSCETVAIQNPNNPNDPYDTRDSTVCTPFDIIQIKRWRIYEEWIFDKQRSIFFPRIIALAPLFTPNLNGVPLPETPMFYVNYQDLRPLLVNEEVFTRGNDAMRLSYYDYFEQRLFSSYITKESNDKDFAIRDFPEFKDAPMDALYESERIKSDMFNWEHDLWEY